MEAIAVSFCLCGCGSRCIWQSGNRRLSVAHALAEAPPNLQSLLGADAADTVPDAPPEKQCACVVERLLRLAFSVEQPQQYCFEPPRKRRRGKQAPALGTLLARSMRAPTYSTGKGRPQQKRCLLYKSTTRPVGSEAG